VRAHSELHAVTTDVDDGIGGLTGLYSVRDAVLAMWAQVKLHEWCVFNIKRIWDGRPLDESNRKLSLDTIRAFLMYAAEHPSRQRRMPMDVDAMVERWMPIIRGLATAHDKATVDQCEFDSEEHLLPLTVAPVKQLRDFYAKLCDRLQHDPTIPFFVWRSFKTWGDVILAKLPDGAVKQLRGDLAKKVADLVEEQIRPDLNTALVGALQWRSPEELERIADAMQSGGKARARGRESCLFLEVEQDDRVLARVML
jgi:hypothetical protein